MKTVIIAYCSVRVISGGVDTGDDSLSFSQIKLRFVILAKFEIQ